MRSHPLDTPLSYQFAVLVTRIFPRWALILVARMVALVTYALSPADRRALAQNLSEALGLPPTHERIRRLSRRVFLSYGRYIVDYFLFAQMPLDQVRPLFPIVEGEPILQEALAKGRGVILVSAHLGNWEIGGHLLRSLDYPLSVVGLPHNTESTNRLVHQLRAGRGIQVIEMGTSTLSAVPVLQALRGNAIVAMIGDRDFFNTGRPINFLGRLRTMPTGPVLLAMLSGAAMIPVFVLARPDGTYAGIIESPVPIDTDGDRTEAIDRNLTRLARVFERYIRQHPDQWYCPDRLAPVDDSKDVT